MYLKVYAWELPGVAGNAWNGEPGCSIAIGNSCIWGKFIFLATGRPGDYMEMLLECLRNPRCRCRGPFKKIGQLDAQHADLGDFVEDAWTSIMKSAGRRLVYVEDKPAALLLVGDSIGATSKVRSDLHGTPGVGSQIGVEQNANRRAKTRTVVPQWEE
eukprot:Gb_17138 [translate_table: standard]